MASAFVPAYRAIQGIPVHNDPLLAATTYNPHAFKTIPSQKGSKERRNSFDLGALAKHGLWRCSADFNNLAARVTYFLKLRNDRDSARQLLENCLAARYAKRASNVQHQFAYGYVEKAMNEVGQIREGEAHHHELRWQPGGFVLVRTSSSSLAGFLSRAQAEPEAEPEPEVDPTYEEWKAHKKNVAAGAGELKFANDATLADYKKRYAAEELEKSGATVIKKSDDDEYSGTKQKRGKNKGGRTTRRKNGRRRTQKKRRTYV